MNFPWHLGGSWHVKFGPTSHSLIALSLAKGRNSDEMVYLWYAADGATVSGIPQEAVDYETYLNKREENYNLAVDKAIEVLNLLKETQHGPVARRTINDINKLVGEYR